MKVLIINVVCGIRSTGRICTDLATELEAQGHEVRIAYGREDVPVNFRKYAVKIGSDFEVKMHGIKARLFDGCGFGSKKATDSFLRWAEEYNPDLLWLHNIHGYYINIVSLFEWIKARPQMKVKWTLHDCWAFTGHCTYFTMVGCEKWKTHCINCPQKKSYPTSIFLDRSKYNYDTKKSLFCDINNLQLITPSQWLADLTRQSFLGNYPVEVKYNSIDLSNFKPTESNFREIYEIENKIVILGVASIWEKRKGLQDFYKLAHMLNDKFVIVLVGLSKKQLQQLPLIVSGYVRVNSEKDPVGVFSLDSNSRNQGKQENIEHLTEENKQVSTEKFIELLNGIAIPVGVENLYKAIMTNTPTNASEGLSGCDRIIAIPRTKNVTELAEIYTAADLFVNPTYEDNYPTVNLEAIACGTKVITYDIGGSSETLKGNVYENNSCASSSTT